MNKLIKRANSGQPIKIFKELVGEYQPGYLYGTVKTHKQNNPLRPIISQIPTPVYSTSKMLNKLISPYLPARFQNNSTDNFIDILKTLQPTGSMASLDVESLFTNVPVRDTIDICRCVYTIQP